MGVQQNKYKHDEISPSPDLMILIVWENVLPREAWKPSLSSFHGWIGLLNEEGHDYRPNLGSGVSMLFLMMDGGGGILTRVGVIITRAQVAAAHFAPRLLISLALVVPSQAKQQQQRAQRGTNTEETCAARLALLVPCAGGTRSSTTTSSSTSEPTAVGISTGMGGAVTAVSLLFNDGLGASGVAFVFTPA